MRLASIVEYDGTNYHGFQYQRNALSIQEELEEAIRLLTAERVRVRAAGRTDAGVHARGQVVAFDTMSAHSPDTFVRALNYHLPDDIALRAAYRVADGFDPRREALSRRYRYTIVDSPARSPLMRRTAYQVLRPLRVTRMRRAAELLVGRHDFRRFGGPMEDANASTVRDVYEARVRRSGEVVTLDVVGSSFLPHQVRRMAGSLVDVGQESLSFDDLTLLLEGKDGEPVARSLPPQGLCLMDVSYADFPPKTGERDDD